MSKRKRTDNYLQNIIEEETEVDSWSRYIALVSYKKFNNNVTFHNRKKINGCVIQRVPLVELGMLNFPDHLLLPRVFSGVRVARSRRRNTKKDRQ
jgi:hypothetical protein